MHYLDIQGSEDANAGDSIRVVTIMANALDGEMIRTLLSASKKIDIVLATIDFEFGISRCQELKPRVLIVDPKVDCDAVRRTAELAASRAVPGVILLDDQVRDALVASILPFRCISYFTRNTTIKHLANAVQMIARKGERLFDPLVVDRIVCSQRGLRLNQSVARLSVAALTKREQQVLELLAKGRSVRDCADDLHLSASTVDNHKGRLMKKLQVNKTTQLVHFAIRDGLITV